MLTLAKSKSDWKQLSLSYFLVFSILSSRSSAVEKVRRRLFEASVVRGVIRSSGVRILPVLLVLLLYRTSEASVIVEVSVIYTTKINIRHASRTI